MTCFSRDMLIGGSAAAGGVKEKDVIESIEGKSVLGSTVRDLVCGV